MSTQDMFRFDGKRILAVGGSTGIGAAAIDLMKDLGAASVVNLDRAPSEGGGIDHVTMDLASIDSIDSAFAQLEDSFDVVISCAGVAPGAPNLHNINFFGQRHLIERLVSEGRLNEGAAVTMIASMAGRRWEDDPKLAEYVQTEDFDAAQKWLLDHAEDDEVNGFIKDYNFSKKAVCLYVARQAFRFSKLGHRINAVLPGTIDTKLARDNDWFSYEDAWRAETKHDRPTPDLPAYPLVFLSSDAARLVHGTTLLADGGYTKYLEYDRDSA